MRGMPTAAKLVAALCFAATAWLSMQAFTPKVPEGMPATWMKEAALCIGVLVGWFVLGPAAGQGLLRAPWLGISRAVVLYFWVLFGFSFREMILRSLDKRYDGPMEAVTSMIDIGLFFGKLSVHGPTMLTLLSGAVLSGIAVEIAYKLWR